MWNFLPSMSALDQEEAESSSALDQAGFEKIASDLHLEVVDGEVLPEEADRELPEGSGGFWTAQQLYDDMTRWPSILSTIQGGLTFCYDPSMTISAPAAARLLSLNRNQAPHWSRTVENTYYNTGGKLVQGKKKFLIAFSRSVLPHPVVFIAFPGMEMGISDVRTVTAFWVDTEASIAAHAGFIAAADSCFALLKQSIETLLVQESLTRKEVQFIFCGHSLGGAVATLSAYKLVNEWFDGANVENSVVLFTLGQPKSLTATTVDEFNATVKHNNYLRFVAYGTYSSDGVTTATDPITGFRRAGPDIPDSLNFQHAGVERMLNTHIMLVSEPFVPIEKFNPIQLIAGVVGVAVAQLLVGKERFQLHNQAVYYAALVSDMHDRQRCAVNTHHTGVYCPAKRIFFQQMWWDCCGRPDAGAPYCQPGPVRKHRGRWKSIMNYWDCTPQCPGRLVRGSPGCDHIIVATAEPRHHPARYSRHKIWHCCMKTSRSAPGCQTGPAYHHPKEWHTHRKFWDCCKNKKHNCKGCVKG